MFVSAFVLGYSVQAQEASISNVLNLKSAKQTGQIVENDKLVGYFVFYFKEKEDSKNSTYEIEIFDDNYNSVKSFEITRPKKTALLEMVYNGSAFMLFFYDRKTGYEFTSFDKSGKKLGSKTIAPGDISQFDLQRSAQALAANTDNVTIYPLGSTGFVRQTYTKNKKMGYELVAYDNEMNELWSNGSPETSKLVETVEINEVAGKYVTATLYKRKSAMSKKMSLTFIVLDSKSGELVTELQMGGEDEGKESVLKAFYDESLGKLILIGEYYKPGDDILKDKSVGLYIQELDESGTIANKKQFKWKGDIDQFKNDNLSEEDQKEAKDAFSLFFHNVIRSKDGKLFLVGEQFKKQLSAGGTAMNVLAAASGGSSDASNFEIRVGNMVVITFDSGNEIIDFDIVEKKKTSVLLPAGAGLYGSTFLGYYVASMGGFDYAFTSADKESDAFTVIYTDYNRKAEKGDKKADKMLGVIHVEGGTLEPSRVPINTDAKAWWIQPAKPGFVSVVEYYKKEKKLTMHLEKLAY